MRVAIFGASGGTGRELVRISLERGYDVTALARSPEKLAEFSLSIRIVTGDVLDPAAVRDAVAGADAVLSALGAPANTPTTTISRGVAQMIDAMRNGGLGRLIVVSASAIHVDRFDSAFTRIAKRILQRVFRHVYADLRRMEAIVTASDRDWTVVVPPRLLDGPGRGRYSMALNHNLPKAASIRRADLALAMLAAIGDTSTERAFEYVASP